MFRRFRVSMSVLRVPFDRVRPLVSSYTFDSVPHLVSSDTFDMCSAVCVCPPIHSTVFRILCPPIHSTVFRRLRVSSSVYPLYVCNLSVFCVSYTLLFESARTRNPCRRLNPHDTRVPTNSLSMRNPMRNPMRNVFARIESSHESSTEFPCPTPWVPRVLFHK